MKIGHRRRDSSQVQYSKIMALPIILSLLLAFIMLLGLLFFQVGPVVAQSGDPLSVEIVTGYNLVVDSNTKSPSTYAPGVATVMGRFCNVGSTPLTDVYGYIGDGTTPGTYPSRDSSTFPDFDGLPHPLEDSGTYAFQHMGGKTGDRDAKRDVGPLAPGECRVQYWHFRYPHCENVSGVWQDPPCTESPAWGDSVKPGDDLWLEFKIWATGKEGTSTVSDTQTWTMTMRNEISAMANKIKPNPDGRWFNLNANEVQVSDIITSNGILYELGNIRHGFDNNDDYQPDFNAWMQPIGDPTYDPTCFRLIRTSGVITVSRSAGQDDLVVPFDDRNPPHPDYGGPLYFTNLPPDNNGVRGRVYYTFQALTGKCTAGLTPYQEVASGFDNEKFNGDYGTGIPPLQSALPKVTLGKSGPGMVAENVSYSYSIPFANEGDESFGLTLSTGGSNTPFVVSDTVPLGLEYICDSAGTSLDFTPNNGVTIRYSKDAGQNWSTSQSDVWTECADADLNTNPTSMAANLIVIQWWMNDPIPKKTTDPAPGGTATFDAKAPSGYIAGGGDPVIENCADGQIDSAVPFIQACAVTLIEGTGSIGDFVWQDEDGDGDKDTGGSEPGISNVKVSLYWDRTGNGVLDAEDVLITDTLTSGASEGNYDFSNLPAGNYLVKVDKYDSDIPPGYTPTTPDVHAVSLADGQDYDDADFGFGPTLKVYKNLTSSDLAYVKDEDITFNIDLVNSLPGDGTEFGFCRYTIWARGLTVAADLPATGTGTKAWASTADATGYPDDSYAYTDLSDASDFFGLTDFNKIDPGGNITKVEYAVHARERDLLADTENLIVRVFYSNGAISADANHTYDGLNDFDQPVGSGYIFGADITSLRAWTWSDFAGNLTEMQLEGHKSAAGQGNIEIDAAAYVITTDDLCGGADTTIATLPLTDTYDADYLEFLHADPPVSAASTSGLAPNTTGVLTWTNLGPLYPGGTRKITVTFKALTVVASPGTTNTAYVREAKFGNGRDVNDDDDDDNVIIAASGSISGVVWADTNGTSGWDGSTGYDGSDTRIPNVTVELYGCFDLYSNVQLLPSTVKSTSKPCTDGGNEGEWRMISRELTDSKGRYLFDALRDGYYDVRVDTSTLPANFTSQTAEPDLAADGAGSTCGTCNNQWNTDDDLNILNDLDNSGGGEDITDVSFGYANTSNLGAVVGNVWHDTNSDGVWDTGEPPIEGATVTLYCAGSACASGTVVGTTDVNGFYSFSGLSTGPNALYEVEVTPPSGMSQTGDPDVSSPPACIDGACDNRTSTPFTLLPNEVKGPYDFGYDGGLNLGDTVYVDWNGDGSQNATSEEGIADVEVYLYRDWDGDGVIDYGTDTLLAISTTNTSGYYQFSDLPGNGADYLVVINESTIPAGFTQTGDPDQPTTTCTTCDGKSTETLNTTSIDTADFGYRPRGQGTIGDFVWIDTDGDGIYDVDESGVSGVTVNLYQDQDGDGVLDAEDALVETVTTIGYNIIDGYIDYDGDTVINEAGDSLADLLGYQLINGRLDISGNGSIGSEDDGRFVGFDVVDGWLDINGDGSISTEDDGSLYGRYWFNELLAGDYIVETDASEFNSGGELEGLTMTTTDDPPYDVAQVSHEVDLGPGEEYEDADFGFSSSVIGDFIWQDNNGDGSPDDSEPGISGVTLTLIDCGPDLACGTGDDSTYGTATTNSTGYYEFAGLPAGDYRIIVDGANFTTGVLQGYTLTYDPDAYDGTNPFPPCTGTATGCDSISTLDNTNGLPGLQLGQIDRTHDFGYQPPGLIGDVLWIDANGNGIKDGEELGISNITVELNDGSCTVGTDCPLTETDSDGNYYFGGLDTNDRSYTVIVHDYNHASPDPDFPSGLALTYDPDESNPCAVCNSQGSRTLTPAVPSDLTVDFGYRYTSPTYSINGHVFYDSANDGGLYAPLSDVPYATIHAYLWNSSNELVATTTTGADGSFTFSDLPNGTYTVSMNSHAPELDGTTMTATPAEPLSKCTTCNSYNTVTINNADQGDQDFGFWEPIPLSVVEPILAAGPQGKAIRVSWETLTEIDIVGFSLYRAGSPHGPWTRLNTELINSQAPGSPVGSIYQFLDVSVAPATTYYYQLEVVSSSGQAAFYGPVSATTPAAQPDVPMPHRIFLPMVSR